MSTIRPLFLVIALLLLPPADATAAGKENDLANHPLYSTYQFGREGRVVDIGTQPLAVPTGVIAEVLKRDLILQRELATRGWEFRNHSFSKGPDANFFFKRGDLDLVIGGDWPTISLAASHEIIVVGLAKQSFSTILARKARRVEDLKGERIGVTLDSTAHYGLLVALKKVGLSESDIVIVPLENHTLLEALTQGKVDAFAAWEPVTITALRQHPELKVVQRFMNNSYFAISQKFVRQHPEITDLLVAAYVRALRWMRADKANLLQAAEWTQTAGARLLGKPTNITIEDITRTTEDDLLKLARSPGVPRQDLAENGSIQRAFAFLQEQDKIPASVTWPRLAASFDQTLLDRVLANPKKNQLLRFDYEK